jgi:hypothetical protein
LVLDSTEQRRENASTTPHFALRLESGPGHFAFDFPGICRSGGLRPPAARQRYMPTSMCLCHASNVPKVEACQGSDLTSLTYLFAIPCRTSELGRTSLAPTERRLMAATDCVSARRCHRCDVVNTTSLECLADLVVASCEPSGCSSPPFWSHKRCARRGETSQRVRVLLASARLAPMK